MTAPRLLADVDVSLGAGPTVELEPGDSVRLRVPPLSRAKLFAVATMWPKRLEVEAVSLTDAPATQPASVSLIAPPE